MRSLFAKIKLYWPLIKSLQSGLLLMTVTSIYFVPSLGNVLQLPVQPF